MGVGVESDGDLLVVRVIRYNAIYYKCFVKYLYL